MTTKPIGDLTLQDLQQMIRDEVKRQLTRLRPPAPQDTAWALDWLDENLIIPQPGTPSTTEMLREDRDR